MKSQPKKTLLIIAIGLSLINLYFKSLTLIVIPLLLVIIALTSPKISYWIEKFWFKLSSILGFVSNRVILFLVFFIILTPIAFLFRITRKNKRSNNDSTSNYKVREYQFDTKDLKNTW